MSSTLSAKWNVLVTGAAGFIGFHLARKLTSLGHKVVGIDSFTPYYSLALKQERVSLLEKEGISFMKGDIREECVKSVLEKEKITHIVHLAAQAGVRYSLQNPQSYIDANIHGFLKVLEAVRAFPHIPLAFASSSSVYGTNTKLPFSEQDVTDTPANLYGATKKANEVMAYSYHHLFKLKMIGLRFFTVYGPWGRPDMAYFLFADKIRKGEPIELFGEGKLRRDFTYIDDIVDGIIQSFSSEKQFQVYNLGKGHPETVIDLVTALEKSMGKKAHVVMSGKKLGDMDETFADIALAKQDFHFSPKISLQEGIDRFVSWFIR